MSDVQQLERYVQKEFNPAKFIEAYYEGSNLKNADLVQAITFFRDLEQKLSKCGPMYRLNANAMRSMLISLEGFAESRGLIEK